MKIDPKMTNLLNKCFWAIVYFVLIEKNVLEAETGISWSNLGFVTVFISCCSLYFFRNSLGIKGDWFSHFCNFESAEKLRLKRALSEGRFGFSNHRALGLQKTSSWSVNANDRSWCVFSTCLSFYSAVVQKSRIQTELKNTNSCHWYSQTMS